MKKVTFIVAALVLVASCCNTPKGLVIEKQGVFSSGGTITAPLPGNYDPTKNWMDPTRAGTTTHVDHANTFYQIPAGGKGLPVVFLHGYGQTRTGWQATPDGREGWSDIFLRKGHPVFLVDQPRRGAAAATEEIVTDPGDVNDGKFKVGEQAWYTHFRIGRVAPERYEGSQFPKGAEAQNQFFCQMTPNTGNYDEALFGSVLSDVLADVKAMTGKKSIYITHSQGGRVGWATDAGNIAAIVAIEPGFGPMLGSAEYQKFLKAGIPMLFIFGDYIMNGPEDIQSTGFWQSVLSQCRDFAEHYNADGGNATVIYLPEQGITGNSHFMFQELNNAKIADVIDKWLKDNNIM